MKLRNYGGRNVFENPEQSKFFQGFPNEKRLITLRLRSG
jgi:hypothetical protein